MEGVFSMNLSKSAQITFLYYQNLDRAIYFFENILMLELVEDQGFAKIYCIQGSAYIGIVDEKQGFLRAQDKNAVLITLIVDDVDAWYTYLQKQEVKILTGLQDNEQIKARCFFVEGPGGYAFEFQQFLGDKMVARFHK